MRTAEQIKKDNLRFTILCRNVFSSGEGPELIKHMKRLFVDVKLYQDTDRETVYSVAQCDFVRELESHIVSELPVNIED